MRNSHAPALQTGRSLACDLRDEVTQWLASPHLADYSHNARFAFGTWYKHLVGCPIDQRQCDATPVSQVASDAPTRVL